MAIASTTVWEVRTTGDAGNGGGFNSARGGTDYSQQDSAQLSLTDLACASNTTLTSATGGFTSAMVGNVVYIASGTNALVGYYEITAYTDTNTVTIDRTCADGGNMTAGVGKVGGATNHPDNISSSLVAQNVVYIKKGTYQKSGANDYVLNLAKDIGQYGQAIIYIGYDAARTTRPKGSNRPILDGDGGGANEVTNVIYAGGTRRGYVFHNFIIKKAISHNVSGGQGGFINCQITLSGASGIGGGLWGTHFSELDNNAASGSTVSLWAFMSYFHDNASGMWQVTPSVMNIFDSTGEVIHGSPFCVNNIYYNATSRATRGTGTNNANSPMGIQANNIFLSPGSHAYYQDGSTIYWGTIMNNMFYDIGGSNYSNISWWNYHDTIEVDPKLNSPATGDFTLQSGSPLIGAGLDTSTFTSLSTDFNVNIGVDQTNPDGGGGGTTVSNWFAGE